MTARQDPRVASWTTRRSIPVCGTQGLRERTSNALGATRDIIERAGMLARRRMSVGDFAKAVGITPANVAVLKDGRARAIRVSTLEAICWVLERQAGDIPRWIPTA